MIYTFRVADYGFTKLIELFEAIPTTIEITEDVDGERILQLTDSERLKVVGDHIGFLIKHHSIVVKRRGKPIMICTSFEISNKNTAMPVRNVTVS